MQMSEASEAVKDNYLLFFASSSALYLKLLKTMYTINYISVTEILTIYNKRFLCF